MKHTILVVDDQPEVRELLNELLTARGFGVECMSSGEDALAKLGEKDADLPGLMILDLDFGAGKATGLDVLATLASSNIEVPTILLSGAGTVESAVQALKLGAVDFLEKDMYLEENLELSIEKAERLVNALTVQRMLREENAALKLEREIGRAHV